MGRPSDGAEGERDHAERQARGRPMLAGIEVREDDIETPTGIHLVSMVVRISSIVIFVLAVGQFVAWWLHRPPGGAGIGLLVGDTIRLIVVAALLWAAGELASLMVKTHYDIRATRILAARQTYMMQEMRAADGQIAASEPAGNRRMDD